MLFTVATHQRCLVRDELCAIVRVIFLGTWFLCFHLTGAIANWLKGARRGAVGCLRKVWGRNVWPPEGNNSFWICAQAFFARGIRKTRHHWNLVEREGKRSITYTCQVLEPSVTVALGVFFSVKTCRLWSSRLAAETQNTEKDADYYKNSLECIARRFA